MSFLNYLRPGSAKGDSDNMSAPATRPTSPRVEPRIVLGDGMGPSTASEEAVPTKASSRNLAEADEKLVQLAENLRQEAETRMAEIASIRTESSSQKALLAKLSEQVLAGASVAPPDGGKKEQGVTVNQQMELQAAALREGLMDIQQQRSEIQQLRTALVALASRFDQLSCGAGGGLEEVAAGEAAIAEIRSELAEVREGVGTFRSDFCGQVEDLRREFQALAAVPAGRPRMRSTGSVQDTIQLAAECVIPRGVATEDGAEVGTQALRKEIAEELAHMEQRFMEITQALDAESLQRRDEVDGLKELLDTSQEHLENTVLETVHLRLRQDLADEQVKLRVEQQMQAKDLASQLDRKADEFERKLKGLRTELEEERVSRSEFLKLTEEVHAVADTTAGFDSTQGSCVRGQLEGLATSLSELDARQGACEGRLLAELGRVAAAVDIAHGDAPTPRKLEELQSTRTELRRVAEELDDFKSRTLTHERSLALEIERVAMMVDSAHWTSVVEGESPTGAELRESALREPAPSPEVKEPVQAAQPERLESSNPNVLSGTTQLTVPSSGTSLVPSANSSQGVPSSVAGTSRPVPVVMQPTRLIVGSAAVPVDAVSPWIQRPVTMVTSSVSFPAGGVKVSSPASVTFSAQSPSKEFAGMLQPANSPRGSLHSVPAAMHGLTEAARALQPGSSRRKALIIACSYCSSQAPLRGTLNDAWNILSLLRHTLQYAEDQVRFLIDGSEFCKVGPANGPTQAKILEGLEWLLAEAQPGDDLFLYFGGYGTQQPLGPHGDFCEACLVPTDFADGSSSSRNPRPGNAAPAAGGSFTAAGQGAAGASAAAPPQRLIPLADVAKAVSSLPASCKVTILLDCCFSTMPGLSSGAGSEPAAFTRVSMNPPPLVQQGGDDLLPFSPRARCLDLGPASSRGRVQGAVRVLNAGGQLSPPRAPPLPGIPEPACSVHCFSACQRPQWCVELPIEGIVQGAFTWAWVKALISVHLDVQVPKLHTALKGIMGELKDNFPWLDQTPVVQVSASTRQRSTAQDEVILPRGLKMPVVALPSNHRRRKALLVGVNYSESNAPHVQLKGCVNDAWNFHSVLRRTLQFSDDQIRVLVDGEHGVPSQASRTPTRANVLAGLQWLVAGAQPGDCLVFLFCGYGAQHPREPGSEEHEAYLVPSDFAAEAPEALTPQETPSPTPSGAPSNSSSGGTTKSYRLVSLLEVNRLLAQLPARSGVTVVLDCSYPVVPGLNPMHSPSFPRVSRGRVDYRKVRDFVSRPRFLELPPLPVAHTPEQLRNPVLPECLVHCFCACRLEEWGCELPLEGTVQGTFTWAFTKALAAGHYKCSASKLLEALQRITSGLKQHFQGLSQTPVLLLSRAASAENLVLCP